MRNAKQCALMQNRNAKTNDNPQRSENNNGNIQHYQLNEPLHIKCLSFMCSLWCHLNCIWNCLWCSSAACSAVVRWLISLKIYIVIAKKDCDIALKTGIIFFEVVARHYFWCETNPMQYLYHILSYEKHSWIFASFQLLTQFPCGKEQK